MTCSDCRDQIGALLDEQLSLEEAAAVREHLAGCPDCTREYEAMVAISNSLKEGLVQYAAPIALEDRIREALANEDAGSAVIPMRRHRVWVVAAGVAIAVAASAVTYAVSRRAGADDIVAGQIVASHIRSLMPGHLTDVASTNLHNVKPWFAGRVDLSPPVPNLDSAGFPLAGGRLDYIDGRPVAALVYMRRQHVINVYTWPTSATGTASSRRLADVHGYHVITWRTAGIELWAISDVDPQELERFAGLFR